MVARERADGQPSYAARSSAHLQHDDCPDIATSATTPSGQLDIGAVFPFEDSLTAVIFAMIERSMPRRTATSSTTNKEEKREAAEVAERQARLLADEQRVRQLRAAGFQGAEYEIFRADLAAYGYPVIRSWIRRRLIFDMCKALGRGLEAPDDVREYLAMHEAERQELALETVARALRLFERLALREGIWAATRGASLTTYFTGACLRVFPNVFRAWYRDHQLAHRTGLYGTLPSEQVLHRRSHTDPYDADPAGIAATSVDIKKMLASLPESIRLAATMMVEQDMTYGEIAEALGCTEDAIKQKFHRTRTEVRRRRDQREGS